uniref:AT10048p n=1 Tax=Drosophila melanogaster TaxID=7227 RepID=Q8INM2_DROME|eukprot:NP_731476.1 uncharacterized protein Dmel_CG31406, isoform B [Drosophila melanogaster]
MVVTRSAATKKQNQVLTLSDQNILAESSRTKGPPVPKKNVKKLPTARQCVKVAANLLDAQEPNENENTGTQRKDGKQLDSKLSSTVQNTEAARSKETPAPKKNVKKLQAALPCADAAANLLEEQASNEMNEEGPPVPKKNVKKLPAARQCVKVAANLLDAQESIENEKTGTKRKDGKQLQAQNSNENEKTSTLKKDKKLLASKTPEAATNDNANPNMKPSLKKSTREHKSKKCNDIQKAGKDHIEHQAE